MMTRYGVAALKAVVLCFAFSPSQTWAECVNARERCGSEIASDCLARVGAGAQAIDGASVSPECAAQFEQYRTCLRDVIQACGATGAADAPATAPTLTTVGGACPRDVEQQLWDAVKASDDPVELTIFVETCPESAFARLARRRIEASNATAPPVSQAPRVEAPQAIGVAEFVTAQTELRRLSLYNGPIDGDWGRGSAAAMRAFQQSSGLSADGRLTSSALAALKAAPTPPPSERPAQRGYAGVYRGSWKNDLFDLGGAAQFRVLSYDATSGAFRGEMSLRVDAEGRTASGVISGRLIRAQGGSAKGVSADNEGGVWDVAVTFHPSSDINELSGAYSADRRDTLIPIPDTGTFRTRRVN